MARRRQPVLASLEVAFRESKFFHLDRSDLDRIVETLNERPRGEPTLYAEALIRLIMRLKGCGGNLKKMIDGDPELAKAVAEGVSPSGYRQQTEGRIWCFNRLWSTF